MSGDESMTSSIKWPGPGSGHAHAILLSKAEVIG